jgi:hypothetical protein
MAHKGKIYELHFRRDLHANLDNSKGWPKVMGVTAIIGLNNGFLGPSQPIPWYSNEGVFIGGVSIKWESSTIVAHGANWFWRMTQTHFWSPPTTQDRIYEVFRNGVLVWQRTFDWGSTPIYGDYSCKFVSTVTHNDLNTLGIPIPLPEEFNAKRY